MKKSILFCIVGMLFIGANLYAANGDLIVNGNVGIGTVTPGLKLSIYQGAGGVAAPDANAAQMDIRGYAGAGKSYAGIRFRMYEHTTGWGSDIQGFDDTGAYGGALVFRTGPVSANAASVPVESMRIASGGNVGIGTMRPLSKLHLHYGTDQNLVFGYGNAAYLLSINDAWSLYKPLQLNGMPILLNPDGGGNVGIGTTTAAYTLDVAGTIRANNVSPSDIRFKENIISVDSALDKVLNIQGVSFNWKRDEFKDKNFPQGRHYGVIAQEIEKVLPEIVNTASDGTKSVAYTEIIPVLIEAIKEQQKEIEQLKKSISEK